MFVNRSIYLLTVTVLIALTTHGQTPSPSPQNTETSAQTKEEAQAKVTAQAYELLDAIVKDIQRLRLPQNRAHLSVTVGELLWNHDKQAALALFKEAAADLRAILSEQAVADGAPAMRQKVERAQLREKVLFAIARHDSRMALDLLAETRPTQPSKEDSQGESEVDLETRLAAVIAENDPTHAIEMARKSLAKGFSNNLPNLLLEIRQKDPEAAADLASDILTKLKTVNLSTNQEAANLALRVFEMATEETQPKAKSATKDAKPLLSEQSLRDLAELIAAAALSAPPENGGRQLNIGSVLAQLEKYAPSRAQELRRLNAQSGSEIGPQQQAYQNYQKLVETGNAEALIAAADKADPGLRESYYREAAQKLVNDDKIDQARQLINEHISDPDQRQQMLSELDRQVLTAAAAKGKMEETRKLIAIANTNEERIAILTQLAIAIAEKGDKKVALQILEEARNLSAGRTRYSRQLLARLQIANAYALVDASQSLAILEPSIDQLNELIGAGILLGEFFGEEEFVRDDELLILFVSQLAEVFQQQFGKSLALLAAADFARTRDAADRFQRFEVRIMARLLVAQSVLMPKDDDSDELPKATEGAKPAIPDSSKTEPAVSP